MSQPEKDQKTRLQTNASLSAMGLAGQIGCVIPVIILAAVLGGVWLDKFFNTSNHLITVVLVLGSLPLSIYLTFFLAMRAVRDINRSLKPPGPEKPTEAKEDETGEQ
jgi:F0F1-type ATP synthase assembly protein I